jgi:hypothetical protein
MPTMPAQDCAEREATAQLPRILQFAGNLSSLPAH